MAFWGDSIMLLHFLYRNGPVEPEAVRALELRCAGDTLGHLQEFIERDAAGRLSLNPIIFKLLGELEGNLGTFPPQNWLFQFPLADRYDAQRPMLFVAMPFGPEWSASVQQAVERAAAACGFRAVRGDATLSAGTIMNQVWDGIRHADAVIADVTGRNPNVLYEAGMAHAIGKPVVLLMQDHESAPFDIAAERRIHYDVGNLAGLEAELQKAIPALPRLPHQCLADLDS